MSTISLISFFIYEGWYFQVAAKEEKKNWYYIGVWTIRNSISMTEESMSFYFLFS